GISLTNMQLQKLVYFAHGWHLALTKEALIDTPVKAWNFGPVIPPLYNALKQYGNGVVTARISKKDSEGNEINPGTIANEFVKSLLGRVWKLYGKFSGSQLSAMTHEPGSPWDATYKKAPFTEIPDDLIFQYFEKRLS